jgi:hypothetical protein
MIQLRRAAARSRTRIGWLDSRDTFSFGDCWQGARGRDDQSRLR